MISLVTQAHVDGVNARTLFEFLLNATDREFQTWWPGVHLRYQTLKRFPNYIGNVMYLDQYIGDYRVKATEVIVEAVPYKKIVRQVLLFGAVRVPVRIVYDFEDDERGLTITHTINAGFSGLGRFLDFGFRCFFTKRFNAAMDEHLLEEFQLLKNVPLAVNLGKR